MAVVTNEHEEIVISQLNVAEKELDEIIEKCDIYIEQHNRKRVEEKLRLEKEKEEKKKKENDKLRAQFDEHQHIENKDSNDKIQNHNPINHAIQHNVENNEGNTLNVTQQPEETLQMPYKENKKETLQIPHKVDTKKEKKPILQISHKKENAPQLVHPTRANNNLYLALHKEGNILIDTMIKEIKAIQNNTKDNLKSITKNDAKLIYQLFHADKSKTPEIFAKLYESLKNKVTAEVYSINMFNETSEQLVEFFRKAKIQENSKIKLQKDYYLSIVGNFKRYQNELAGDIINKMQSRISANYNECTAKLERLDEKSESYKSEKDRILKSHIGKARSIYTILQKYSKEIMTKTKEVINTLKRFEKVNNHEIRHLSLAV